MRVKKPSFVRRLVSGLVESTLFLVAALATPGCGGGPTGPGRSASGPAEVRAYATFRMSDGGILTLKNANNADRLKRPYAGPVAPDELIADSREVVTRAVTWLLGGG